MTESKIERKILYIVIFVLIGILITLIFVELASIAEFKVGSIFSSPIFTILGSSIGTGITAFIALKVMKSRITYDEITKSRVEKINSSKFSLRFIVLVARIRKNLSPIKEYLEEADLTKEEFNRIHSTNDRLRKELKELDDSLINHKEMFMVIAIEQNIEIIGHLIGIYLYKKNEEDVIKNHQELNYELTQLDFLFDEFVKNYEKDRKNLDEYEKIILKFK